MPLYKPSWVASYKSDPASYDLDMAHQSFHQVKYMSTSWKFRSFDGEKRLQVTMSGSKLQTASVRHETNPSAEKTVRLEKYFLSQSFWNSGTQLEVGSSKKASNSSDSKSTSVWKHLYAGTSGATKDVIKWQQLLVQLFNLNLLWVLLTISPTQISQGKTSHLCLQWVLAFSKFTCLMLG